MGRVVAFMDDLFFQMKLAETAKHVGVEVKVASTAESLRDLLQQQEAKLLIVDLNARNQPLALVPEIRAGYPKLRTVAFLSHVQADLAREAKSAGFDQVLPRSVFSQNLSEILSVAKESS